MRVAKNNPSYGRGVVEVDTLDLVDEDAVKMRILEVFRAPDYKPPTLPAVALEVMNLSQRVDVSFADVARVLSRDGMMTGQVIKLVQSPVYGGQQQISSIHQAIVRLGLRTVRDLVIQVALDAKVFRCKPYAAAMDSLRRHSIAVAHLGRIISKYTAFYAEYAFLCGLMHDVGLAGSLISLAEHAKPGSPPPLDEVWPAVMGVHEEASSIMVKTWGLPPEVSWILGAHHRIMIDGYPHPIAAMIAMANDLSDSLGCGLAVGEGRDQLREPGLEPARRHELAQHLALGDSQLALIAADAEALVENLDSM